jgi:predicted TIM-barrel fold metal-dependent hydrolase
MTANESEKVLIISVDGHVAAPMADYRPYLESRYHTQFDEFLIRYEAMRAGSRSVQLPELFAKGELGPYQAYMIESGAIDGEFDPDRRLKELTQQGVVGDVLFPNRTPFQFSDFGTSLEDNDPYLIEAGQRAYNRWLADFVSHSPERWVGLAQVSFRDVDDAVKTVEWAREHGLKGVLLPGIQPGAPRLHWDPALDRFWSALEDTGLTANGHIGAGTQVSVLPTGLDPILAMRVMGMEAPWHSHRPLTFMMWSGVFERHPRLKTIWTEQFSDWIPRVLTFWDWTWNRDAKGAKRNLEYVPRKPSEYWAQSCWAGMSLASKAEVDCRHIIGVDKVMFGVDFPHVESTYPNTLHTLQALGKDVSDDDLKKFVGLNAAALWHFDVAALRPIVDEVGFTMGELRAPPPPDIKLRDDIGRPLAST